MAKKHFKLTQRCKYQAQLEFADVYAEIPGSRSIVEEIVWCDRNFKRGGSGIPCKYFNGRESICPHREMAQKRGIR